MMSLWGLVRGLRLVAATDVSPEVFEIVGDR
jgi:hypothetical protein